MDYFYAFPERYKRRRKRRLLFCARLPPIYSFEVFNPLANFTTWAAKEVGTNFTIPQEFNKLTLLGGNYADREHIGTAANIGSTLR